MSFRPAAAAPKAASPHGSLFGPAINAPADGFWSRLAVSPPRSPPTTALSTAVPMPPEFSLDGFGCDAAGVAPKTEDASADASDAMDCDSPCATLPRLPSVAAAALARTSAVERDAREVPVLESVCPTWAYDLDNETALVVFDHDQSGTMALRSTPRRIHNRDPVTAKAIAADALAWKPMRDPSTGTNGYVFQLMRTGSPVCRIEVTLKTGAGGEGPTPVLERVAVVQATYAPLALAAGVADRSSLLVYDDPLRHLQTLHEVRSSLGADPELGYAPVSECCVTSHFDRLALGVPLSVSYGDRTEHESARRAWGETKEFLKRMSSLTADCIDEYVEAEIRRTGAHELRPECKRWRRVVS